jgi:hypothetical protein
MNQEAKQILTKVKPHFEAIMLQSEEDIDIAAQLAGMQAAFYARVFYGVTGLEQLLGVVQKVTRNVQPQDVAFAMKLSGNRNWKEAEVAIDKVISNQRFEIPKIENLRKVVHFLMRMRKFLFKIKAVGPFGTMLKTEKQLLVNGELTLFRDILERGFAGANYEDLKTFLNGRGMIHHFRL